MVCNLRISNILYATDKQNDDSNINDVDNYTHIVRQKSQNDEKGTIYYNGEHCAYNMEIDKEDNLNIYLFEFDNSLKENFTIINYFSNKKFNDINLYFNNKKVDYVMVEK